MQPVHPLLGGEGWGEGGHQSYSLPIRIITGTVAGQIDPHKIQATFSSQDNRAGRPKRQWVDWRRTIPKQKGPNSRWGPERIVRSLLQTVEVLLQNLPVLKPFNLLLGGSDDLLLIR